MRLFQIHKIDFFLLFTILQKQDLLEWVNLIFWPLKDLFIIALYLWKKYLVCML